jgi:undecaprenyl-diphosphatase
VIETFDNAILNWFQSIQNDTLTWILKVLTSVGHAAILWILLGLILVLRKKTRWVGVTMLAALILCGLVGNLALKPLIARPRPCWVHPEIVLKIANPTDYSFPSGHAMSSFAAATVVLLWNRRSGIAAFFVAVLMACSRLYFYVHYPTDVLAGALIGILLGWLSYAMIGRERKNKSWYKAVTEWRKKWKKDKAKGNGSD